MLVLNPNGKFQFKVFQKKTEQKQQQQQQQQNLI